MNNRLNAPLVYACLLPMCLAGTAHGAIDLIVTGSWQTSNFDVSPTGPSGGALGIPEENDDRVFGIAPSAGSTTFTIRVNGPADHVFATGDFGVLHDWHGYSNVQLIGTHTLGTASWETADIISGLMGPNGTTAALWTDTDLSTAPDRISFRMFGDWTGEVADLFVGPRTLTTIGTSFQVSEYFAGENLFVVDGYTATVAPVPEPATIVLAALGLAALLWSGRKRAA